MKTEAQEVISKAVEIPAGPVELAADLAIPERPSGVVIFAHGSGSSRFSQRNREVAERLNAGGFATLLLDLLTAEEEGESANVFDIELLAERLSAAVRWTQQHSHTETIPVGFFGASTGAAAALRAAADLGDAVSAVVSRGGRPDLAGEALWHVRAPTLLIVGGADDAVLALNEKVALRLRCRREVAVIPGATHLFEEPGALERVAELALGWFAAAMPATYL